VACIRRRTAAEDAEGLFVHNFARGGTFSGIATLRLALPSGDGCQSRCAADMTFYILEKTVFEPEAADQRAAEKAAGGPM
jgi:hypothetical protein